MRNTVAFLAVTLAATTASAEYRGFTGAVAANGGATYLTENAVQGAKTEAGLGYTLTLGGFVTPSVALAGHVNVLFATFDDTLADTGATVTFGPVVQYWPGARINLLAGLGYSVASYQPKDPMSIEQAISLDGGWTPMVGAAWYPLGAKGLRVSLETSAIVDTDDGIDALTYSANVGWQFLRTR